MRADRLLKLADFLETVPRRSFKMTGWIERDASKPEGNKPGQCGFSGCAVGWAVHAQLFAGLGFSGGMPVYNGRTNWNAVVELFEFEKSPDSEFGSDDAYHLFYDEAYTSGNPIPKTVAKRIRKFVKDKQVSA